MKIATSGDDLSKVADLEGALALWRPITVDERDTQHGRRLCCECVAWRVGADGTAESVGTVLVWNDVLIRVLGSNIGETLAGRVERPGKAYIFAALTDDEIARAERAEKLLDAAEARAAS